MRRSSVAQAGRTSFMGIADPTARRLERRWAPRYSFRTGLDIEWGSAVLRAITRDVSASGMFIESTDPLWVGAGFSASLQLEHPIRVDCRVRRVEPGLGMGVSVSFPQEQQQNYQELISKLSQAAPGPESAG
jgi:PilZ domain